MRRLLCVLMVLISCNLFSQMAELEYSGNSGELANDVDYDSSGTSYFKRDGDSYGFSYANGISPFKNENYKPPIKTPGFDLDVQFDCNTIGFSASFQEMMSEGLTSDYLEGLTEKALMMAVHLAFKMYAPQAASYIEWLNSLNLKRYQLSYMSCQDILDSDMVNSFVGKYGRQSTNEAVRDERPETIEGVREVAENVEERAKYIKDFYGVNITEPFFVISEAMIWPLETYPELIEKYFGENVSLEDIEEEVREYVGNIEIDPDDNSVKIVPPPNDVEELYTKIYKENVSPVLLNMTNAYKEGKELSDSDIKAVNNDIAFVDKNLIHKLVTLPKHLQGLAFHKVASTVTANKVITKYANYIRLLDITVLHSQADSTSKEQILLARESLKQKIVNFIEYQKDQDKRLENTLRAIEEEKELQQKEFNNLYYGGEEYENYFYDAIQSAAEMEQE